MRGSIQPKGDNFYVVLAFGAKRKWVPGGKSRRQAEKVLAEELSRANKGPYKSVSKILFRDFATRWLEQYARPKLKESTYRDYERSIRLYLTPFLGDFPLSRIGLEDIQQFVSSMVRKGDHAPKTINNMLVPLKEMFKHACRWGYLREDPSIHVEKPKVPRREMDFLNPEEIRKLRQAFPPEHEAMFLMAVMTGMRRGEILATKWRNVDWNRKQYHVRESLYGKRFVEPKSEYSKKPVNLSPELVEALKQHRAQQNENKLRLGTEYQDTDLIFCQANGKMIDPNNWVRRVFHRALKSAGIRHIRFQDLRHTYTSLLIEQKEHPKYIQSQLRHASIQTTMDRYGHLMSDINYEAGPKLDKMLFGQA